MNRQLRCMVGALIVLAVCMIATERPALAYVNPGSGTIIWQSVLALIAGMAFSFRRITFWFKTRKGRKVE